MTVGEYRQLSLSYSSNNLDMEIWCKYAKDVLVGHYFLLAMERMFTLGDRQKMISTPDKPTKVFIGDNVSLVWQYYKPAHLTLFEVVFGYWKSPGYLHPKLIAVDSKGVISVRAGYETAVSWDGNLTSSLAVFVLYNVQPADGNVDFGIQVEFGLAHNPLKDIVQLLVVSKPIADLPRITDITTPPILRTGQNVNLSCTASGLSLLNVTWHRGKNVVSNHGNGTSTVVIGLFNITQEDWGEYTCVTQNEAGEDRRTVFLRSSYSSTSSTPTSASTFIPIFPMANILFGYFLLFEIMNILENF